MGDFLLLVFAGVATGSIYALAALGFTLLWQASGTINFAQGEFVMLPAFMMLAFIHFGAPLPLAFALTCVVAVIVLGWAFKRGIADPLLRFGMMPIVVATIGLSIAASNGVRAGYSAEAHPFPSLFPDQLFEVLGVTVALSVFCATACIARPVTVFCRKACVANTSTSASISVPMSASVIVTPAMLNSLSANRLGNGCASAL